MIPTEIQRSTTLGGAYNVGVQILNAIAQLQSKSIIARLQSMALFAKILGALKGAPRSAGAQKQQIVVKVHLHKVLRGANLTRVDLNSLLHSEKLGKFRAQKFSLTINRVV